jgi:hypothetical protein
MYNTIITNALLEQMLPIVSQWFRAFFILLFMLHVLRNDRSDTLPAIPCIDTPVCINYSSLALISGAWCSVAMTEMSLFVYCFFGSSYECDGMRWMFYSNECK